MPLVALIFGSIVKAMMWLLGFQIFKLLTLIGFSVITYQGVDFFIQKIYGYIRGEINQLPDFILQSLSVARFDVYISIILSAYAIKFSIRTAKSMQLFG